MKKITIITMFFATITTSFGQVTIGNVNINKLDIQYCQLIGFSKDYMEKKINITVDYGQEYEPFKPQEIKGPDGKIMEFRSMVDALNFMGNNGWTFVEYIEPFTNITIYRYMLKKSNVNKKNE